MISKEFILGGKATFTIEVPRHYQVAHGFAPKPHYTWKVTHKGPTPQYPSHTWFCALLVGPDNTQSYVYQGMLNATTGFFVRGKKALPETCHAIKLFARVMKAVFEDRGDQVVAAGFNVRHEGKCCCCGRTLTVPESILTGWGPTCYARVYGTQKTQNGDLHGGGVRPASSLQGAVCDALQPVGQVGQEVGGAVAADIHEGTG